jgi:outer membrane protein insertion porin family
VEYRLPLTADDMISMVVFSDFGTVDDEVQLSEFRATAGFGTADCHSDDGPGAAGV